MNVSKRPHSIDGFFSVLLLLLFAFCTITLVLLGARIYRNGVAHLEENYTSRTSAAYISEKIRQHEEAGCVSVRTWQDTTVLCLEDRIGDDRFYTCIYYMDGSLRELFFREGTAPDLSVGTSILPLQSFRLEKCAGDSCLYSFIFTDMDGRTAATYVHLPGNRSVHNQCDKKGV